MDEKKIEEEQLIFKKNSSWFLYDVAFTRSLEWSSVCVEWLPGSSAVNDREGYLRHDLVIGTHTEDGSGNELLYVSVNLPGADAEIDARDGQFGKDESEISTSLEHPGGEANKIRHLPQRPTIVATKCANSKVYIYDVERAVRENEKQPMITFDRHKKEGFGLSWHPGHEGRLASAGFDGMLCAWDIASGKSQEVWCIDNAHQGPIGDISFAPKRLNCFGTVGDDRQILLWDERVLTGSKQQAVLKFPGAHADDIITIAFPPVDSDALDYFFTTGSTDGTIKLWDCRQPQKEIYCTQRSDEIVSLAWAPFSTAVVAAAGADRRVAVYNFESIQKPLSAEDKPPAQDLARFVDEDTAASPPESPELLLEHSGHTAKLNDVSWNLSEEMLAASVAADNTLQIWWVSNEVYEDDFDDPYSFFDTLAKTYDNHQDEEPQTKRPKLTASSSS